MTQKKISSSIKLLSAYYNIKIERLAVAARIDKSTFYCRLKNPGDFKVRELSSIAKLLHTTPEKLINGVVPTDATNKRVELEATEAAITLT